MLEGITLALHKDKGKDTHTAQSKVHNIKQTMRTDNCGYTPPPDLGSSTRSGCLWHYSTAVQGQPGTKKQRERP